MSNLSDPKEQALFVILVEHDVQTGIRSQIGPLYVKCPTCHTAPGTPCPPDAPGEISAPYHEDRRLLRARTLPDMSDIHIGTRRRIRDLFEHDVYPEDLMA